MENQETKVNLEDNVVEKVKKPKQQKEKKIKVKKENHNLLLISIIAFIGGILVLVSAVYNCYIFTNPRKLSDFISDCFTGELKDNFSFNVVHLFSFFFGYIGVGLIFIYGTLMITYIFWNKAIKRYMWGASLIVAIVSIIIAIAYCVLLSFVLEQIRQVTFAKDGSRFTFKPASWVTKAIGTKYVDDKDVKLDFTIYVIIVQLVASTIGILLFGLTLFTFITGRVIISPEKIKNKKLLAIEKRLVNKEARKVKKIAKKEAHMIEKSEETKDIIKKERRHKKGFTNNSKSSETQNESSKIEPPIINEEISLSNVEKIKEKKIKKTKDKKECEEN